MISIGFGFWQDNQLKSISQPLNYLIDLNKFACPEAIEQSLDENTILFLGSSELGMRNEKSHPKALFNDGNSDFNIMQVGGGYNQSLSHAIDIGAYSDKIVNKKVVLNLSPQWFTEGHIEHDAFASKFYERVFAQFIKSPDVSDDTKQKIVDRCKTMLDTDPTQLERIQMYEDIYLHGSANPVKRIYMNIHDAFMETKIKKDVMDVTGDLKNSEGLQAIFDDIDFDLLMKESEAQGKADCTNNSYYVLDEYYDTYMKPDLESRKDAWINDSFCTSAEYDDLRLFLDVCKETGIEPMLINIPVNGFWYDYQGFPREDRQQYYQNIRDIASEYDVRLLDLSEHEYTPYFLRDIMHLGWKGWVYIDQGVYEFAKEDNK